VNDWKTPRASNKFKLRLGVRYGLGFVITAFLYLVSGTIIILVGKSRFAKQRMIPKRSALELKRDEQWLREEF
jgi:Putative Actinobacterial Holin-X, holin superfamily III